ncbi:class I tRNA ligase family protein, partial [Patescibacteria group bacterium]|nr:class I tRNA ligase family protein [Patescibacteria group bacterium]
DPDHVMYVWCDALTNYISAIGYSDDSELFHKYWPADVHLIGKDIIRFHAAIWPGMLMAAGLPLPKHIMVHGFIHSDGQRMSKTIGNVIDPARVSELYGQAALRLILLKEIPVFGDGDLTMDRIGEIYHAELANKLGNLLSRVIGMYRKYSDNIDFSTGNQKYYTNSQRIKFTIPDIKQYLEGGAKFGETDKLLAEIWQIIETANKYIEQVKPWEAIKKIENYEIDPDFNKVFYNLLETLRIIGLLLEPFSPTTSHNILTSLNQESVESSHNSSQPQKYLDLLKWGNFQIDSTIKPNKPLFPRIEK